MKSLVIDTFREVADFDWAGLMEQGREGMGSVNCDMWVVLAERFEEDRCEGS